MKHRHDLDHESKKKKKSRIWFTFVSLKYFVFRKKKPLFVGFSINFIKKTPI